MDPFSFPEDLTALSDDELSATLESAVAAFNERRDADAVTQADVEELRALAAFAAAVRTEQASRIEAATQAAAEIDALSAQVNGINAEEDAAQEEGTGDGEPAVEAEAEPITAAAPAGPTLNLSAVRARARQKGTATPPAPPALTPRLTAAVDVPGFREGAPMQLADLVPGAINRANALKAQKGGVGIVASYHHPFPDDLIVDDPGSAPEGSRAVLRAGDQRRLPQGDLVASGGWCAPSETEYSFLETACPDMLWDAPEIQLRRGGLRYFLTPDLDTAAMTWVHTEADDIAGNPKPCFKIPCEDPIEVRCEAIGICIEAGILTQKHFPELVSFYLNRALIAHEIRIKQELLHQLAADATPVTIAQTSGALSPVFGAVGLQAADMIERHSLCDSISLEVVFPWWSRNFFLADLARRNGVGIDEVSTADVQALFTPLGVSIQWARGITSDLPAATPPVSNGIGGPTPATVWPDQVQFLMYPAGQVQIGRGAEVDLGVIHDSTKFTVNDYTAAFTEECVALVNRSSDTRLVTVPTCADGTTGAQPTLTCPVA